MTRHRQFGTSVAVAAIALAWAGCNLDASQKNACVTQKDCLSGYRCEDLVCKAGLGTPSLLRGTYDEATTDYRLAWQDNSGEETSFEIECQIGSGAYAKLGTTPANATAYVTRFYKSQPYRFRVRAVNDTGSSDYSNELVVDAPVLTSATPDRLPTKPAVSKKPGTGVWPEQVVLLSWNAVDFRGEKDGCGYDIVTRGPFGNTTPWDLVATLGLTANSYQITAEWISFDCKVIAFNTYGESESDVLSVTISDYPQP